MTPVYEPKKWNNNKCILKSHNCYMYALNKIDRKIINTCKKYVKRKKTFKIDKVKYSKSWEFLWARPGKAAGYSFKKPYECDDIIKGIILDSPSIKYMGKTNNFKCPKNYYRMSLSQNKSGREFHFYRQDKSGLWSHKNGWRKVTNKDCNGDLIADPKHSSNGIYNVFCGYFLVPNNTNKKRFSNVTKKNKFLKKNR